MRTTTLSLAFLSLALLSSRAEEAANADPNVRPAGEVVLKFVHKVEIPEIKRFNKGVLELLPGDTVHLEFEEKGDDLVNPKVVAEVQHPNRTITFKMTQDESMTMLFRESAIEKAVAFDCTHRGLRSEEFATTYLNPTEKGLAAGDSWPNSVWILRLSNIEASSKPASEIYMEKVSKGKEKQEEPATDEAEPAQEEQ